MGALHAGLPTPTTCAAALEPRGGKGGEGSEPQLLSPAGPAFPTCKCSVTLRFNFLLFLIFFRVMIWREISVHGWFHRGGDIERGFVKNKTSFPTVCRK